MRRWPNTRVSTRISPISSPTENPRWTRRRSSWSPTPSSSDRGAWSSRSIGEAAGNPPFLRGRENRSFHVAPYPDPERRVLLDKVFARRRRRRAHGDAARRQGRGDRRPTEVPSRGQRGDLTRGS